MQTLKTFRNVKLQYNWETKEFIIKDFEVVILQTTSKQLAINKFMSFVRTAQPRN